MDGRGMDDRSFARSLQAAIDGKTKPQGALGRIEALAAQIATLQGTLTPRMEHCTLLVFAADHGVAAEGVSAYPQSVTREMLRNFLAGGAAANVFAATLGVELRVVDAGVAGAPVTAPELIARRIGPGTANLRHGPAMSGAQLEAALQAGAELAAAAPGEALACGEMGIGNTAAAALVAHRLTGLPLDWLVGRGTGLDETGLARKREILAEASDRVRGRLSPEATLAEFGGFEIAMMTGAMEAAAGAGRVVLVDGFIATAAAVVALARRPGIRPALVFAHRSAEAGHGVLLDWLAARPLLELEMRLGEGTGALLAWPLLRAAAAMLRDMASFESAGVSGPA